MLHIKVICLFFFFHYTQSALLDSSCRDIRIFVNFHNAVRLLLANGTLENQPPASEMNSMVWDEELAAKAAKWASTYTKSINPDQTIPSGRFLTSQSISMIASKDPTVEIDPKILAALWFDENSNYTYGPFSKDLIAPSHAHVKHYTQMVWSNSIYLGCAISQDVEDGLKNYYVVCEYGPSANIVGQVPYKTGPPSNSIKCVADENHCKHPYGEKCPGEE